MSSLTLITEEVIDISKEENITLNCTYQTVTEEIIFDKNIRWSVRENNVFKDVAVFSRPGGYPPYIAPNKKDLYINRTELIAPTDFQLSAVLIIKNPTCTDEGTYQCSIKYTIGTSDTINVRHKTSIVQFNGNYISSLCSRIFNVLKSLKKYNLS